jgi:flagellin
MSFYINTNVSSIHSQRNLGISSKSLDNVYARLSSGVKLNKAKDDASGLQISNRMTTEIEVISQGNRNANDCISMCQVVEGALDEVENMLHRMRTLAVQSRNGTNSSDERSALNDEFQQLSDEIMRVGSDTTYGSNLFVFGMYDAGETDNSKKIHNFKVGADGSKSITVDFRRLDELLETNVSGSNVCLSSDSYGVNNGYSGLTVSSPEDCDTAMEAIDSYLRSIGSYRGELGAVQNRLDAAISNQENVLENLSDARSRIRDTDYARETAEMARLNILQQASASILTQANQRADAALNMLK